MAAEQGLDGTGGFWLFSWPRGGFEQPATNLISPGRVALATNWVTNGTFNNIDTQATNARRFYRAEKVH